MKSKQLLIGLGLLCFLPGVNAQIGGKIGSVKDKAKEKVSNTTGSVAVSAYDKHMKAGQTAEEKGDFILAYKEYKLALAEKSGDYMASSAKSNVESKAEEQFVANYKASLAKGNCADVKTVLNDHMETIDMTPTSKEKLAAKINSCEKDVANMKQAGDNAAKQPKQDALLEQAVPLIEAGRNAEAKAKLQEAYDACPTCDQAEEIKGTITALDQMTQMEDMKYKCSDLPKDNGVSSPTHTKYMNKIVFSKTEIVKGQENEGSFTNSFSVTDNIYARVYIENSIRIAAGNVGDCFNPTYFIRWTFDDGKTKMPEWINTNIHNVLSGSDGVDTWTTWQPGISPSSNDMNFAHSEIKYFIKYVKNLPAGSYKIKMEVVYDIPEDKNNGYSTYEYTTKFGPEKVLATGEFNLSITEEGKKQLYKKACPLYKSDIDDYNSPAFTVVSDASTLIKQSKNVDWNKFTLLKIVGDNDWTYKKNVYGIITSRSCAGGAYLLNKEDNFIYYSNVSFYQENISSGGSKYGSTSYTVEAQDIDYVRNYDSFCKECIGK